MFSFLGFRYFISTQDAPECVSIDNMSNCGCRHDELWGGARVTDVAVNHNFVITHSHWWSCDSVLPCNISIVLHQYNSYLRENLRHGLKIFSTIQTDKDSVLLPNNLDIFYSRLEFILMLILATHFEKKIYWVSHRFTVWSRYTFTSICVEFSLI